MRLFKRFSVGLRTYLIVLAWPGLTSAGEKKMAEYFYKDDVNTPVETGFAPALIHDDQQKQIPDRATPQSEPMEEAIGQPQNGRLPANLKSLAWEIHASSVLRSDRVVDLKAISKGSIVRYDDSWEFFDTGLKSRASQAINGGVMAPDPARDLVYAPDGDGFITAWSLIDGSQKFAVDFDFGSSAFSRSLLYRKNNRMLSVAVEMMKDPHGAHQPSMSVLEVLELQEPLQIASEMTRIAASKRVAELFRNSPVLQASIHKDTLIVICRNFLYLLDLTLEIKSAFQGEFTPLWHSLDESGRIHLIAESKGQLVFWVLSLTGRRILGFPLSKEWGRPICAPVIGYDHGVILTFEKRVVAVSPLGKKLWDKEYPEGVGGVSVTPDGHVLVAAGREVLALEPEGQRNVLIRIPGESLKTRPAMNDAGDLLVAGSKNLYRLSPKK